MLKPYLDRGFEKSVVDKGGGLFKFRKQVHFSGLTDWNMTLLGNHEFRPIHAKSYETNFIWIR